jgi:hypothetical protein
MLQRTQSRLHDSKHLPDDLHFDPLFEVGLLNVELLLLLLVLNLNQCFYLGLD